MTALKDISSKFRWNPYDASVASGLIQRENDAKKSLEFFCAKCAELTDYSYWFLLSTLWILETENTDFRTWKKLFSSDRSGREKSIMKPSELIQFKQLPYFITAYRAHRPGELDYIAYTLDLNIAKKFAELHSTTEIKEYQIKKRNIIALFLRRNESEIIVPDRCNAKFIRTIKILKGDFQNGLSTKNC